MANVPVNKGQIVGYNTELVHTTDTAIVIGAPTILPGGKKNFDENNVPECVDLLVLNYTGDHLVYRVRHASSGDTRGWVELTETPEWSQVTE